MNCDLIIDAFLSVKHEKHEIRSSRLWSAADSGATSPPDAKPAAKPAVQPDDRTLELRDWLLPVRTAATEKAAAPLCSVEALPSLVARLKQYADDVRGPPRSLATVLRLLRHLAVPPGGATEHGEREPRGRRGEREIPARN